MKDKKFEQRIEKMRKLQDELLQWQQVVVGQQLRIARAEAAIAALTEVLNTETPLESFIRRRILKKPPLVEEVNRVFENKLAERRAEFEKQRAEHEQRVNGQSHVDHVGDNPA